MSPGPGNMASYWDGAERNFGYMRSRHVCGGTAHPGGNPANLSMGEFDVVAAFLSVQRRRANSNAQYGVRLLARITGLELKLTTSTTWPVPELFNAPGTAGQFNVAGCPTMAAGSRQRLHFNQGSSPHDPRPQSG